MSKILIKESHSAYWFERLSTVSYYSESEFEMRLLNQATLLFKEFFVIPFKKKITHLTLPKRSTKPDLAFIKRDYSQWFLVEVELNGHQEQHVLDQVDVMLNPNFNSSELLTYMKSKAASVLEPVGFKFDETKLDDLLNSKKPEVLVIVDETKVDWETTLNNQNVRLCVVQVYKNGVGEEILRLKGQYPRIYTGDIHCRSIKFPPNSLEIINHFELLEQYKTGDIIEIYFNELVTKWNVVINRKSKCILKCAGPYFPLPVGQDFILKIDEENNLYYFLLN
jgi:hypothetical protein